MALISVEPVRRDVPGEPGQYVEIRQLSRQNLKEARKAKASEQREEMKAIGAEFIAAITNSKNDDDEERIKRLQRKMRELEYDISNFDVDTLLRKGLAGFSYGEVNEDTLALLEEGTANWAAEEILTLSKPKTASHEKNNSAPSTSS